MQKATHLSEPTKAPFRIPTDLTAEKVRQISGSLNLLLADVFALYLKTKSFHWHMIDPHFRDYHLLFDEQAAQLLAMTDNIAERMRKIGGLTFCSIGDISRHQRLRDNYRATLSPTEMLSALCSDNKQITGFLRLTHQVCERNGDVATGGLVETWIDETEQRTCFLSAALADLMVEYNR